MKKRLLSLLLTVATVLSLISVMSPSASAADPVTNYSNYSTPSNSSDYAYWSGSRVVRASGTTTSEVKWMQAAINYCIKYGGLQASYLAVDGSFGPASQAATKTFQSRYGLTADGSFGPKTIQKMKSVLASLNTATQSKILNINWSLIQQTGKQSTSGPCFCFALAYARDILDGYVHQWYEYEAYGSKVQSKYSTAERKLANFNSRFVDSKSAALQDIFERVKAGKPVVINVNGGRSTGEHYVCVVGYTGVTSTSTLSESNFLIIDSAGGPSNKAENLGDLGYKLKWNDGQGYYYCFE